MCAPDVAVCVATAHYRDTVQKIQQSLEHAAECEAGLSGSLELLQRYRVGEDIQAEVQDTLEVISKPYCTRLMLQNVLYGDAEERECLTELWGRSCFKAGLSQPTVYRLTNCIPILL